MTPKTPRKFFMGKAIMAAAIEPPMTTMIDGGSINAAKLPPPMTIDTKIKVIAMTTPIKVAMSIDRSICKRQGVGLERMLSVGTMVAAPYRWVEPLGVAGETMFLVN